MEKAFHPSSRRSKRPISIFRNAFESQFASSNLFEELPIGNCARSIQDTYVDLLLIVGYSSGMNRKFNPNVRLSLQSLKVLSTFIAQPRKELSGADIQRATDLRSGTLYPILLRLEEAKWFDSRWEDVKPKEVGRPRRRLYRITTWGLERAKQEMASLS